ncbi:unnamed protein product [Miscanthus lutarioriparius]|uniref:glutathione transferase n=1 Tax=Miscanthus lutarioriparius TaxID=422564 RepID=A0A811SR19_9POAL|nr:unnamed protein product [Miscanthus lutarioriparius]
MATPAVKVYGWAISPFVSRALLALEEAGVDYQLVPMSRQAGDHHRPEHLARNPFRKVPVLEDGDLTLFESRAIARHVLRKHKPELLGTGSPEQATMCIVAPFYGRERNQAIVDENVEKLKKVLVVYEARLSQSKYLAGDFLSLAELSHFTMMHYLMATEYATLVEALPHVSAWWEGLATRPAAKKVAEFMPVGTRAPKKQE